MEVNVGPLWMDSTCDDVTHRDLELSLRSLLRIRDAVVGITRSSRALARLDDHCIAEREGIRVEFSPRAILRHYPKADAYIDDSVCPSFPRGLKQSAE